MNYTERFWRKVDRRGPDECWPWLAAVGTHGYGVVITIDQRQTTAHRVAYELEVEPIREGLTIDHLCRNRVCMNPAHMEAVTQRENILRGNCMGARHARKTHCPRGH